MTELETGYQHNKKDYSLGNNESFQIQYKDIDNFPDNIFTEEVLHEGVRLMIPRGYIFGTQEKGEYDSSKNRSINKTKLAKKALKEGGINYLKENPVILCTLPGENALQLALVDGHHRTRYAPRYGIRTIPSIILTAEQTAPILTEVFEPKPKVPFTSKEIEGILSCWIAETLNSFKEIPDHLQPRVIPQATTIDDLQRRFESF